MSQGHGHRPDVRVTMLFTDPNDYAQKKLMRFKGFVQVKSSISMNGPGSASVTLNNKSLKYFQSIVWPDSASERTCEIEDLKSVVKYWARMITEKYVQDVYQALSEGKLIYPYINAMDFIWIDYKGRDGTWYPGFTGVVTGFGDTDRAGQTPQYTINAKGLDHLLRTAPIVYGLANLGNIEQLGSDLINWQDQSLATQHIFQNRNPGSIFAEVLTVVNQLLNLKVDQYESFYKYRGPDGTKNENLILFDSPAEYLYEPDEFAIFTGLTGTVNDRSINDPDGLAYYKNPMGKAYYDSVYSLNAGIYQMILRNQFNLTAVDVETAQGILNKIAQTTMSFVYVDQTGTMRYEYPRYATYPSIEESQPALGRIYNPDHPKVSDADPETPYHAWNYWISREDASFISYVGGEDESQVVATRATVRQQMSIANADLKDDVIAAMLLTGYDNAPPLEMVKYGLREVAIPSYFLDSTLPQEVLNAYAKAARIQLNVAAKTFSIDLDQRPDLMLNRTFVYVDRGRIGLITDISDSYSPSTGHVRTLTCKYARYMGEPIAYPWKDILNVAVEDLINREPA